MQVNQIRKLNKKKRRQWWRNLLCHYLFQQRQDNIDKLFQIMCNDQIYSRSRFYNIGRNIQHVIYVLSKLEINWLAKNNITCIYQILCHFKTKIIVVFHSFFFLPPICHEFQGNLLETFNYTVCTILNSEFFSRRLDDIYDYRAKSSISP